MKTSAALCALFVAVAASAGAADRPRSEFAATPIIAEVVGEPTRFVGRRITIYGIVVESRQDGRRFLLQDVSQRPLMVLAPQGERAAVGNQLMISGTMRRNSGELELEGDDMTHVQVVAGGGCC